MHTLSMEQALGLWSDLEQAYYKTNGYGGDTAEIYLYRLVNGSPSGSKVELIEEPGVIGDCVRETYDKANQALYNLLLYFSEQRGAYIEIDGKALGTWLKEARFCHRVHVKVTPR